MKTLLLLAALSTATPAFAQDDARHFEEIDAYYLANLSSGTSSCADLLGPQTRPEDTVSAMVCAKAIQDYFLNYRGEDTGEILPDQTISSKMKCAANLVLARAPEKTSVKDILAAEFDGACQPATM